MKYYLWFTALFALMLGWNAFLVVRDNKMFKAYDEAVKERNAQICAQIKEFSPDCK